jgi:two-component system, chemotaxis family, chemotaxis protein CheY
MGRVKRKMSNNTNGSKKVLLVGHCGPDSSYLKAAIRNADKSATVLMADDSTELHRALEGGVDLVLFNRELGYGFDVPDGASVIKQLRAAQPDLRMILVSNYPDAQQQAVVAGAMPGFGKRELGSPRVTELLRSALNE